MSKVALMFLQLLFEEFGKWLNASANATMVERNDTFATVFDESEKIMDKPETSLKGIGETPCSESLHIIRAAWQSCSL